MSLLWLLTCCPQHSTGRCSRPPSPAVFTPRGNCFLNHQSFKAPVHFGTTSSSHTGFFFIPPLVNFHSSVTCIIIKCICAYYVQIYSLYSMQWNALLFQNTNHQTLVSFIDHNQHLADCSGFRPRSMQIYHLKLGVHLLNYVKPYIFHLTTTSIHNSPGQLFAVSKIGGATLPSQVVQSYNRWHMSWHDSPSKLPWWRWHPRTQVSYYFSFHDIVALLKIILLTWIVINCL